jgi:hypothetical protein
MIVAPYIDSFTIFTRPVSVGLAVELSVLVFLKFQFQS